MSTTIQPLSADAIQLYTNGLNTLKSEFQRTADLTDSTLSDFESRLSTYDCLLNGAPRVISNLSELALKRFLPNDFSKLRTIDLSQISDADLQVLISRASNLVQIVLRENQNREFQWLNTCKLASLMIFRIPNSPLFNNSHLISVISTTNRLHVLNISGCSAIDLNALALISISCPNLTYLDISNTTFDLELALTRSLDFPKVRFFEIANCIPISRAGIETMSLKFPQLVYFNASGTDLDDDALILFAEKYKKSIFRIDLAGCKSVSGVALRMLATTCQALRALNLTGCDSITQQEINGIAKPDLKIASSFPQEKSDVQIISD